MVLRGSIVVAQPHTLIKSGQLLSILPTGFATCAGGTPQQRRR